MNSKLEEKKEEQNNKSSSERFLNLLKKYIGTKVFLAALCVIIIGLFLIYLSFGKSDTNLQFFILPRNW